MPGRRTFKPLLSKGLLVVLLALVMVGCGQQTPQTMLDPSSESARTIYNLSVLLFWLGAGVFVVVEGILIYSIFKYRHRHDEQLPAQIHGNTKVEIAWTLAPAVVAVGIFIVTFQAMQKIETKPDSPTAVQVEVIGHQWWWEFRYPNIKDANGRPLVTANEMWVPSGEVVDMTIKSVDVIHDFWIPGLAGKRDAIPNHDNKIWFQADAVSDGEPQTFWGQCAEYCGTQHAYMKMRVVVASPGDFQRWVDQNNAVAANPTLPAVFSDPKAGCLGCHAIKGTNAAGITGPDLTHFGSRQTIAAGTLDNTPENLRQWLDDPNKVKRGNLMAVKITGETLTPEEIDELVEYLSNLK